MSDNRQTQKDLQQAQKLIKAGKYEEARRILITVEHPTADKWLARINEIATDNAPVVIVQEKKRGGCLRNIGIAVVSLFACLAILGILNTLNDDAPPANSGNDNPAVEQATNQQNQPVSEAGNRTNPHPPGTIQNVIDGRFRVNSIRRNMSARVEEMNIFNIDPDPGEEWVLVNATFHCDLSADEVCTTSLMRFELLGNAGQAYNNRVAAQLDTAFAAEVFGGSSITGNIGFIVNSNDGNFLFAVDQFGQRIFFAIP